MKIMFLDHDGVICLASEWGRRYGKKNEGLAQIFDPFNEKAINVLNDILVETNAEIVVSSDWKYHATLEQLGEWYEINGIIKKPIDTTSTKSIKVDDDFPWQREFDLEQTRAVEIKEWIKEHPEITHWVAVDDLDMGTKPTYTWERGREKWGLTNFVHTPRGNEGIKQTNVKEKILKFLID